MMSNFVKRTPNITQLILIGMVTLFLSIADIQAQIISNHDINEDLKVESIDPSVVIVPPGFAIVSSTAGDGPVGTPTVRVVDITQFGGLWKSPSNHSPTFISSMSQMPLYLSWAPAAFQNQLIFGLTMKTDGTVVYAATSAYAGIDRTPKIYSIGPSAIPVLLPTTPLPGTHGIGSIDLDERHNLIFASNLEDGKIYSIKISNGTFTVFDPLTPDASGTALPPLGERIIAVAYMKQENRVYYSVWGNNNINSIRSIGLETTGEFKPAADDRLEFILQGSQTPVSDIEFNAIGKRMLMAENPIYTFNDQLTLGAHYGRGLEYIKGTYGWTSDPAHYGAGNIKAGGIKYYIGRLSQHKNSRGGVSWVYSAAAGGDNGFEDFVLFTGDALLLKNDAVYGLQFTPASGGSAGNTFPSNSIIADLDYDVINQDKAVYGDVDVRKRVVTRYSCGTVVNAWANPIYRAIITLTYVTNDNHVPVTTLTNPFGYFSFENLPVGEEVELTVSSRDHTFSQPTRTFTVGDGFDNFNFIADSPVGSP